MSLYPTFEDAKVDTLLRAQGAALLNSAQSGSEAYAQMATFMGLTLDNFCYNDKGELVPRSAQQPEGSSSITPMTQAGTLCTQSGSQEIISRQNPADIKSGVRSVTACKDSNGKMGVQLIRVDNGIFVSLVQKGSPAALAGLRFGDQVLSINGKVVAGMSGSKAMDLIRKGPQNNIELMVRDRPYERTISMYKGSGGLVGVEIQDGLIKAIHKDSSAARNGVITNHQIVEVNGQNVIGLKSKELSALISSIEGTLTFTILPRIIFDHLMKNLCHSTVRKEMDRSMPEV